MLGAIENGVKGFIGAVDRLNDAAGRIGRGGADDALAGTMVDLMRARHEARANAAVIRTADATIGTIIDVLA